MDGVREEVGCSMGCLLTFYLFMKMLNVLSNATIIIFRWYCEYKSKNFPNTPESGKKRCKIDKTNPKSKEFAQTCAQTPEVLVIANVIIFFSRHEIDNVPSKSIKKTIFSSQSGARSQGELFLQTHVIYNPPLPPLHLASPMTPY